MAKNQANPESEIAQFVRAARKALKLTQEQFGDKFNRTKANANAWEKGRHEPAFSLLKVMSSESGVPLPAAIKQITDQLPELTLEGNVELPIEESPTFQTTGPVSGSSIEFIDAPYFMGPKLRRESAREESNFRRKSLLKEFLDLIVSQDELTLDQMKPLLKRMIEEPHRGSEIIERINILLDAANGVQAEAPAPKSTSSKAA